MFTQARDLVRSIRDALQKHGHRPADIDKVRIVIFAPNARMAFSLDAHLLHTIDIHAVSPNDVPGRSQDYFTIEGIRLLVTSVDQLK